MSRSYGTMKSGIWNMKDQRSFQLPFIEYAKLHSWPFNTKYVPEGQATPKNRSAVAAAVSIYAARSKFVP